MRTLNRPMFNMGGPIKEGVMHGIREPHKQGGPTGTQAALVGDPVYPKTGGREHHQWWKSIFSMAPKGAAGAATKPGFIRTQAPKVWQKAKNIFGTTPGTVKHTGKIIQPPFQPSGLGKYLAGTPEWWAAKKIYEGKGLITKPIKYALKSPTLTGLTGWQVGKHLWGDKKEEGTDEGFLKSGAAGGASLKDLAAKELSNEKKKAFALQQREERVQKYLKMMGYDRAKKTAIADALIDASKIVGERGSLDPKNITQELISPIIQATSKRLDKPEQIREAVGLMATKAAIEKDLEDPSIKALRLEQLKGLRGSFESDLGDFILSAKGGKVKKEALEQFARVKAKEHGETFTVVDEGTTIPAEGGSGYYMIEDKIFRVVDGTPQQVV